MIFFSDVDIVLKLAACGFLQCLPELLSVSKEEINIQHLLSLRSRVKKLEKESSRKDLEAFCKKYSVITGVAEIVRQQELLDGGLDAGEALLFAEAETIGGIVVTGDKRALMAYTKVSTVEQRAKIQVICWEQLLLRVNDLLGFEVLRRGCWEGINSDKMLSIVFSSGLATQEEHALEALRSYLNAVMEHSGDILFSFDPA